MPLVEITYRGDVPRDVLVVLGRELPHLVSVAVACDDEPYVPPLKPGDVELRFRRLGELDVSGLDVVIEIKSKWSEQRVADRQRRVDQLIEDAAPLAKGCSVGVYLSLPHASWAQT